METQPIKKKTKKVEKGPLGSDTNPHRIDADQIATLLNKGMLIFCGDAGTASVCIMYESNDYTPREKIDEIEQALEFDGVDLDE